MEATNVYLSITLYFQIARWCYCNLRTRFCIDTIPIVSDFGPPLNVNFLCHRQEQFRIVIWQLAPWILIVWSSTFTLIEATHIGHHILNPFSFKSGNAHIIKRLTDLMCCPCVRQRPVVWTVHSTVPVSLRSFRPTPLFKLQEQSGV